MTSGQSSLIPSAPPLTRQDTDSYLSYYSSSLADLGHYPESSVSTESAQLSSKKSWQHLLNSPGSDSASDYSCPDSPSGDTFLSDNPVRRRPSKSSHIATDRRRLAIVETNNPKSSSSRSSSKRDDRSAKSGSKRKPDRPMSSFALIAPPDAAPKAYKDLTPPIPSTTEHKRSLTRDEAGRDSRDSNHGRSRSEAHWHTDSEYSKKVLHRSSKQMESTSTPKRAGEGTPKSGDMLKLPPSFASDHHAKRNSTGAPILTPEIGQSKRIHEPVAAPVVTNVSLNSFSQPQSPPSSYTSTPNTSPAPSRPFSPDKPQDYVRYQPGLHALAGPLPEPPTPSTIMPGLPSSPPPRPPRLHSPPPSRHHDVDAIRQALQLPPSVSAKLSRHNLASDAAPKNGDQSDNDQITRSPRSSHSREGAFPPSRFVSLPERDTSPQRDRDVSGLQIEHPPQDASGASAVDTVRAVENVAVTSHESLPRVIEPERFSPGKNILTIPELRRESSWVSITSDYRSDVRSEASSYGDHGEVTSLRSRNSDVPSLPPKTGLSFSPVKKDSALPSIPTIPPVQQHYIPSSNHGHGPGYYPLATVEEQERPRVLHPPYKKKLASPKAMFFNDVLTKKTAHERSLAYAKKINELWVCSCGLEEWLAFARNPRPHKPSGPSQFTPQPRQTSRSSVLSEVTFPRRPDATVATDLSRIPSAQEGLLGATLPDLPYPSLAQPHSPASRVSNLSAPSTVSLRVGHSPVTPKSIGFFASLGRKASTRKGDKAHVQTPLPSSSSSSLSSAPPKVLTKTSPSPRTITLSSAPAIPGGPRAPPNRMIRSQTVMISSPFSSASSNSPSPGASTAQVNRRPSLFAKAPRSVSPERNTAVPASLKQDPEFRRQVDKLADLLPQADKDVLAGYLYRSGQDILAIGQYLEDEKNGKIKR